MKFLIPILSISAGSILISCGNSDSSAHQETATQTAQNNVETTTSTTSEVISQTDTTTSVAAENDVIEEASKELVKERSNINNDDLENEKFRIAELDRRRRLALEANPSLDIPDAKQIIAKEKEQAKFKKIVEKKSVVESTQKSTASQTPPQTATTAKTIKSESIPTPTPVTPAVAENVTKPVLKADTKPVTTQPAPVKQVPVKQEPMHAQEPQRAVANTKGEAKIDFKQMTFAFDTIVEGDVIDYQFKFVNTGTRTVEILNAKASCGCTRPSYPFLPIEPGQEGYIGVKYDSRTKSGNQTPQIEVVTNFQDDPIMLYLKGFVKDKPKEEASNN